MPLKIVETPTGAKGVFPAKYQVSFTGTAKPGELTKLRNKIQNSLEANLTAQEKKLAKKKKVPFSPRFEMTFKWEKLRCYKLVARVKRISGTSSGGADTQPKPKGSILPM